jgi:hypothetical protein
MVPHQCLRHRRQFLEDRVVEIGKADLAARPENAVLDDKPSELSLFCFGQRGPRRPANLRTRSRLRKKAARGQKVVAGVVARRHPPLGVKVRDVGDIGAQPHLGTGIVGLT